MRLALVTLADGDFWHGIANLARPGKQRYCQEFGYEFVEYGESLDKSRPTSWSKVLAIKEVLPDYDWVWWVDTDVIVWKHDVSLKTFLSGAGGAKVVIQENVHGVNCGVFAVRNDPWSFEFLDRVYSMVQFRDDPWWEQRAIIELLGTDTAVRHNFMILPESATLQGFFRKDTWAGKIFAHFAGMKNKARLAQMEKVARLADYPLDDRVMTREQFGDLFNRKGLTGEGVEVGVLKGEFAKRLLDRWKGKKLHLVDPWRHLPDYEDITNLSDEDHEQALRETQDRLAPHQGRYEIHRDLSSGAATTFPEESLDFVYIDANHQFEHAFQMMMEWYPKVKPGGVIAGHDYLDGVRPSCGVCGVKSAVDLFEQNTRQRAAVTAEREWSSWYLFKPCER